jgi:GT2 family glycosyltransferase
MKRFPKVSVVLPVRYVNVDWLTQSIESVLNQDYPNKELIIVNDEATQPIDDLVASYGITKYIKNDRNRKLPYSLNRGFGLADGDYHTWTSADNIMLPGMLSRLVSELEARPETALIIGTQLSMDESGKMLATDERGAFQVAKLACTDPLFPIVPRRYTFLSSLGACFLYRAEVWRKVGGYDEELHGGEDYKFWIRASRWFRIRRIPISDPPLYAYRNHKASITGTEPYCFTALRLKVLSQERRDYPYDFYIYRAMIIIGTRLLRQYVQSRARLLSPGRLGG